MNQLKIRDTELNNTACMQNTDYNHGCGVMMWNLVYGKMNT